MNVKQLLNIETVDGYHRMLVPVMMKLKRMQVLMMIKNGI